MPKVRKSKGGGGEKNVPTLALADQILEGDAVKATSRVKNRDRRQEDEDEYVDERLSRKILQQARIQQDELESEYGLGTSSVTKKQPSTVLGELKNCEA